MRVFLPAFLVLAWLSYRAAATLPLFGDEAFYWLEGRHPDWSYTDLPGWTAWQAALAERMGGHSYFGLRWLSWLAGLSLPWQAAWLAWQLAPADRADTLPVYQRRQHAALAGLLVLSMPLAQLLGVLALPDIWLLFFTLLITNLLVKALCCNQRRWWPLLAVVMVMAVNVHVRLWIWLVTSAAALFLAYPQWRIWRPVLLWLAPATALGLLPVLIFNIQNDWGLFSFQFNRRHPWQFQPENIFLPLSQVLLVSPLVFAAWILTIAQESRRPPCAKEPRRATPVCFRMRHWIAIGALIHWLFYAITGLFADGQRTSVHWMMASYAPGLALVPGWWFHKRRNSSWSRWLVPTAVATGLMTSTGLWLYLTGQPAVTGHRSARLLDNASGWPQLAQATRKIMKRERLDIIVSDYFMTAAELGFELSRNDILVLPHTKNIKHGRQKQLQLMGRLHMPDSPLQQPALLVVEDSTLKLQDKGDYYQRLCQMPGGIRWLSDLVTAGGAKKFVLMRVDPESPDCQLPAIFYAEHRHDTSGIQVSGWVVRHQPDMEHNERRLYIRYRRANGQWQEKSVNNQYIDNAGVARLFPGLHDPRLPRVGFKTRLPADTQTYQLIARETNPRTGLQQHHSRYFWLD